MKKLAMLVWLMCMVSVTALAQTPSLEPFSDDAYGIQGLRPTGWTAAGPGVLVRGDNASDATLLAQQAAPVSLEQLWPSLLPQFQLAAIPEPLEALETAAFTWALYGFDVAGVVHIELALAEVDGTAYIVLLQTGLDEAEALRASVFLPVLEAFAPLALDETALGYRVEEVTFRSAGFTLAGTLTLPQAEGQHPAVVLMTGSGPNDRDETVVGFPIFRRLADGLTKAGIAVLRYDDRGVAQSEGDYAATSIHDFAADGLAAVRYLQSRAEINPQQVGILGHSEGGVYAAILGAQADSDLAFIISLAGIGISGSDTLLLQNKLILAQSGASQAMIDAQLAFLEAAFPSIIAEDWATFATQVREATVQMWGMMSADEQAQTGSSSAEAYAETVVAQQLAGYANRSFATLLAYDPAPDWRKTQAPVLAVFGELDVQVPAAVNATALEAALEANPDVTIVTLNGANHLFQAAQEGSLQEYATLPPQFTPELLPTLIDWLSERVTLVE